jgi:hypothetical protein
MKRFTEFSDIGAAREEIRRRFPDLCFDSLTWAQIRDVANGDLVPVRSGRKFVLMTKEEVAPGGKLDRRNAEVRATNAKTREESRRRQAEADRLFREKFPDLTKAIDDSIRRCFPKKGGTR